MLQQNKVKCFLVGFYFIAYVCICAIKFPETKYEGLAYANSNNVMIGYNMCIIPKCHGTFYTMVGLQWLYLYHGLTVDRGAVFGKMRGV